MSTIAELQKKAETLEAAHKNNKITAALLMKELASGAVPCAELARYNEIAKATWHAQFTLWTKLALRNLLTGNMPEFPPGPVLFSELAPGEGLNFHCRSGNDLVGPSQFAAARFDDPQQMFFGTATVGDNLGIAPIILIIAGISIAVSATVVATVAIDASKEKALAQATLDSMRIQSEAARFTAEARVEYVQKCLARGGTNALCAAEAVTVVADMPIDPGQLGQDKFGSSGRLAWLFGGGLAVLAVLGGAMLYNNRRNPS
jgi:hypothetical protein